MRTLIKLILVIIVFVVGILCVFEIREWWVCIPFCLMQVYLAEEKGFNKLVRLMFKNKK